MTTPPHLPTYEQPWGFHPPLDFPGYRSTALRAPAQPPVLLPQNLTEITGPCWALIGSIPTSLALVG